MDRGRNTKRFSTRSGCGTPFTVTVPSRRISSSGSARLSSAISYAHERKSPASARFPDWNPSRLAPAGKKWSRKALRS